MQRRESAWIDLLALKKADDFSNVDVHDGAAVFCATVDVNYAKFQEFEGLIAEQGYRYHGLTPL